MKHVSSLRLSAMSLLILAASAGCSSAPVGGESATESASALINEAVNAGEVAGRIYADHPMETRVGYAVGQLTIAADVGSGTACSAEMIGPNIMMTAAHCGPDLNAAGLGTLKFMTVHGQDPTQLNPETFNCHWLIRGWGGNDIVLYKCDANAAGENPGDKYGYLDFDHSTPVVGQSVFSYWWNDVQHALGSGAPLQDAMLYSQGSIVSTTSTIWTPAASWCGSTAVAAPTGAMFSPVGLQSSVVVAPGGSGSPLLSHTSYRIIGGPTTGDDGPCGVIDPTTGKCTELNDAGFILEGHNRWQLPIGLELSASSAPFLNCVTTGATSSLVGTSNVQLDNISALGLAATNYLSTFDKNGDGLFDIQADYERLGGEHARSWYNLGFDSDRRNALWLSSGATIGKSNSLIGASAHIAVTNASSQAVLEHDSLNLAAGTPYRVTFKLHVTSASSAAALEVGLVKSSTMYTWAAVPTVVSPGFSTFSYELDAQDVSSALRFTVVGSLTADISEIVVTHDGTSMDFDTADARAYWTNGNTGIFAPIRPDGATPGRTGADWAGLAVVNNVGPVGQNWPLQNDELAIVPGLSYRLCLDAKNVGALGATDSDKRVAHVINGNTEIVRLSFSPTSAGFTTFCTAPFTAPSQGATLQIGYADNTATQPFLVDNITLTKQCTPTLMCNSGEMCGWSPDGCGHSAPCGVCGTGTYCAGATCLHPLQSCPTNYRWDAVSGKCVKGMVQ
ncbi:MAG: trypsin-like serine peptidase [Polyangiales bacterium]